MRHLLWLVVLLLVAGCGPTTQSGINKEYNVEITVRENSTATFFMGVEADTAAEALAGDAPATQEVKTPLSVALKGAQSGASTDEGGTTIEGNPINVEPIDASNRPVTNNTPATPVPVPVEQPDTGDSSGTDEPGDAGSISGVDTVLYTFPCDGEMTYRDETETEGIPQKVCLFTEFETCLDIPVDKFVMMWKDPTGNERLLEVADKCSIAMDNKANGYGKFRPTHDKEPYKPVAYAPRGFNASEVNLIGKKLVASECSTGDQASDREDWDCMKTVKWEGDPNPDLENKEFSRCWWTDTTGDWHFLQRKFNFTKDKPNSPVLVVFDDGVEVGVSNVGKRHYPGAPGHVKWGVPKLDDGNTCKHYYSLAAPKDATPEAATLYYNE